MNLPLLAMAFLANGLVANQAFSADATLKMKPIPIQYTYDVYPVGKAMAEKKDIKKDFGPEKALTLDAPDGPDGVNMVATLSTDGNQIDFVFTMKKNGQKVPLWSASRPFSRDVKVKADVADKKNPVSELQNTGIAKIFVRIKSSG